jgi:hypothetical protein
LLQEQVARVVHRVALTLEQLAALHRLLQPLVQSMHLQVVEPVELLISALPLRPLAETHLRQVECHPQVLFKAEMVEGAHRSAPVMPSQVKMEMQMQSLDLHTSLVLVAVVVDGMPRELLAVITPEARAELTMFLVYGVVTLVPVVVAREQVAVQVVTDL